MHLMARGSARLRGNRWFHRPATLLQRALTSSQANLFKLTRGRRFARFAGVPIGVIETTGRRTGKKRTTPVALLEHQWGTLVVASDGGSDRHPAWYLNLRADPRATIWTARDGRRPVVARELPPAERDEVWEDLCRHNPGYVGYQKATSRTLPVLVLDPVDQSNERH